MAAAHGGGMVATPLGAPRLPLTSPCTRAQRGAEGGLMSLRGLLRTSVFRYTSVAVLALTLGSASVVLAASTGAMQLPTFRIADGTDPERLAKVDAAGNLQVSVNNTPSTQQVS